mgnify:CR=1 FL=1
MKVLKIKPIPTRNWKNKNVDLVVERDKDRKKSQESVDKRIYYMWFNYLKLCLNLEEINYSVKNKGAKEIVVGETGVKVNRKIYKDWDLNDLYTMNFRKWYKDPEHKKLFTEGVFKPQRSARYHSLVKRYNVFIEYYNGMNRDDFVDTSKGNETRETQVCSDIFEKSQFVEFKSGQKERFDQLKKKDPRMNVKEIPKDDKDGKRVDKEYQFRSEVNDLVKDEVKQCGKEILSCCQGEFPKSS